MFGLQLWNLAAILILTCSFSWLGFISLVDEIQFMLILDEFYVCHLFKMQRWKFGLISCTNIFVIWLITSHLLQQRIVQVGISQKFCLFVSTAHVLVLYHKRLRVVYNCFLFFVFCFFMTNTWTKIVQFFSSYDVANLKSLCDWPRSTAGFCKM